MICRSLIIRTLDFAIEILFQRDILIVMIPEYREAPEYMVHHVFDLSKRLQTLVARVLCTPLAPRRSSVLMSTNKQKYFLIRQIQLSTRLRVADL